MGLTLEEIIIERLSVEERLELIDRIWDSIPEGAWVPPAWHVEELKRRRAAADANPDRNIPLEDIVARLSSSP
jgi:putative addiction module component (TIGR02574 family)